MIHIETSFTIPTNKIHGMHSACTIVVHVHVNCTIHQSNDMGYVTVLKNWRVIKYGHLKFGLIHVQQNHNIYSVDTTVNHQNIKSSSTWRAVGWVVSKSTHCFSEIPSTHSSSQHNSQLTAQPGQASTVCCTAVQSLSSNGMFVINIITMPTIIDDDDVVLMGRIRL